MKQKIIFVLIVLFSCSFSLFQPSEEDEKNAIINEVVHGIYEVHLNELTIKLNDLKTGLNAGKFDEISLNKLKSLFKEARILYKKNEAFSAYFFPASDLNMNGPVISEVEYEEERRRKLLIVEPTGFQVIESLLYSDDVSKNHQEIVVQLNNMISVYSSVSKALCSVKMNERQFIEAIQSEINRHFTLGISQFDTPLSGNSIMEIKSSLIVVQSMIRLIYSNEMESEILEVRNQLDKTIAYLEKVPDISKLEQLECLRECYVPLSSAVAAYLGLMVRPVFSQTTALRIDQKSIFDREGFNAFFYNPRGFDKKYSPLVAELGKILFFDPVLSSNNKRACASCHRPDLAFTDGVKTSSGFHAGMSLSRNAPTILNVALQRNYFYDSRSTDLEDQINHVLLNKNEMMSSFEEVVLKLNSSPEYVRLFRNSFKGTDDTVISHISISNAIAEYERKLISLNSRFDKNVRGEINDFTAEENLGFNVFMHKGNCGACHYLPMFSGLVPPDYTKSEFENIGTTLNGDLKNPVLDPDKGRGANFNVEMFMGSIKTPTLRNIELTGPYMHNGGFNTLEEVVEFYNEGGGAGLGLNVPNQTLGSDKLNLTDVEKKALISFMKTLTDTIGTTTLPDKLPSFPDQSGLNRRKIGGEY
ncbi:MAG: hypothetical protein IPN61_07585 [Bacteroidetes bacterium]|nr:hypothetical protein [Bacteroidota bacterium]MBP6427217.1 hypothetical protein [Bacteroidia bacterium]MBP6657433.1 hypothetical protein [Bacteroidia bacterium]